MTHNDIIDAFTQAMREHGLETDAAIIADGQLHRVRDINDKANKKDLWYILHAHNVSNGFYGHWAKLDGTKWLSKPFRSLTKLEHSELKKRMANDRRLFEEAKAKRQAECKEKAEWLWADAVEKVRADHPYLVAKGVKPYGLRQRRDAIVVPVRDGAGGLVGLQFIQDDGGKRFLTGTAKTGSYHRIDGDKSRVLICEGYATGASLHEATGFAVAIAFDAGNLMAVAQAIREKLPDGVLLLCADDDHATDGNPGMTKATSAALAVGGLLAVPSFADGANGTDFNDMHQADGIEAVAAAVAVAALPDDSKRYTENLTKPDIGDTTASAGVATNSEVAESEDALIARLAELSDIAYYRVQQANAEALGIKTAQLDKLVMKERKRQADESMASTEGGSCLIFSEVEPWPDAINGAELLDHMTQTIQRFTVLSLDQARACALWAAFTWFIDGANVAPLLNVTSPEPRCGKSTLGELIKELSARPMYASNITPAALFRAVEKWKPTLLIDETDAFLNEKEELRGIINAGHYRSTAYVVRVVGEALEPKQFSTWGAKALIGIGKIAHTLTDRSIVIELRRKLETERVEKLRHCESDLLANIQRKLTRWVDDELAHYKALRPKPIDAIHDRAADNWEPLLGVAILAGGEWPARCANTALALSGAAQEAPSINAELLADIKAAFERTHKDRLFTNDLLAALFDDTEAPWATWNRGREMTARQLSAKLSSFGVSSSTIRDGHQTAKGYTFDKFKDAFARYLTFSPILSVTASQTSSHAGLSHIPIRHTSNNVTDKKTLKASNGAGCDVVTDRNPQIGQKVSGSDVTAWDEGEI